MMKVRTVSMPSAACGTGSGEPLGVRTRMLMIARMSLRNSTTVSHQYHSASYRL